MKKENANLILFLSAVLFGSGFVATSFASDMGLGTSLIVVARGLLFMLMTVVLFHKDLKRISKREWLIGSAAGLLNFGGYFFQTLGLKYTTPSNNAFLTCLNTIITPFFAWLIYKNKPGKKSAVSLPVALIGMMILTNVLSSGFTGVNIGDIYSIICAVFFGFLIAFLGNTGAKTNTKILLFMMAFWKTIGGLAMFALEGDYTFTVINPLAALVSLIYLGISCSFLATSLQVYAQKYTSETSAGLILSAESVIASILSVMLGFEAISWSLIIGGFLILGAVIFMIFDFPKKSQINRL